MPGSVPEDVVRFVDEAACGVSYESLADVVDRDRDFVKRRFLVDVLAKRQRYPSPVEDAFRDRYPHVYSAVQRVKKDNHCVLIRHLQRLEAWLVIDLVCARLLRDGIPVITIHDSVYAPISWIKKVENAFDAVFDRLGFRFRLKPDCPQTCPP